MSDLLNASVMTLAAWIRAGKVSPLELVDTFIARMEAVNPAINAVVATRFEQARAEAKTMTQAPSYLQKHEESLPPLWGVPFTVKEYIAVAGMPLTAGIWSRRHIKAKRDAEVVSRLKCAGAIPLGTTNVPEGGLWLETYNAIHGRTVNPWNPKHTSGGSSGGEGAIISAGGAAFGLGADIGGSIRIPAAFCGIIGHKPTGRMIPNTGFWPPMHGTMSAFLTCGPMVRYTEDVMPILRVLAGPDHKDLVVQPWQLGEPKNVDLRNIVVYPVTGNGHTRIHPTMQKAVEQATQCLRERGARIATFDASRLRNSFLIWSAMMGNAEGPTYGEVLGDGKPIPVVREFLRFFTKRSHHTLPALLVALTEQAVPFFPQLLTKHMQLGQALQRELEQLLGPNGVLLHPPYSRPAPRHYSPFLTPFDFVCTGLFNVMEFPATAVPTGFDARGLPVGVQVISRRGHDHLTIAVASAIEQAFGGWQRSEPKMLAA